MADLLADEVERAPNLESGAFADVEEQLQQGFLRGREAAQVVGQRLLGWAKENPALALACAAGAGFVVGKLLSRVRD